MVCTGVKALTKGVLIDLLLCLLFFLSLLKELCKKRRLQLLKCAPAHMEYLNVIKGFHCDSQGLHSDIFLCPDFNFLAAKKMKTDSIGKIYIYKI